MNNEQKRKIILIISAVIVGILGGLGFYKANENSSTNEIVNGVVNEVKNNISTYDMTEQEVKDLPTTEIQVQTEEQEKAVAGEQTVEDEKFEQQGEIAYNGTSEYPNVTLGNYQGLTYYSQIDNRWRYKMYSSVGNSSQTIGTSGCGPTCASMVVTATKGTITPPEMCDLFVKYGYRSANNGTYWSAFRFVADTFNIGYQETTDIQRALQLLESQNYVVASCGNGLFTTGGHFILLTKVENGMIEIYDPYLYAGKFDTATRRGKAVVEGNKVYVSVDNFKKYANYKGFFAYKYDGSTQENKQTVTTQAYTRYVNAKIGLNIRNKPNGYIVGGLSNGTAVTVYETDGNWSRIGTNRWVSSNYLTSYMPSTQNTVKTISGVKYTTGKYKVNASVLNVRTGPSTKYKIKGYKQLTANARYQNKKLGNQYTNGLKRGVVTTVTKVQNGFGLTPSGWISLNYCTKM